MAASFAARRARGELRLACLDLGMADTSLARAATVFDDIVRPGWDLPVLDSMRSAEPHLCRCTKNDLPAAPLTVATS